MLDDSTSAGWRCGTAISFGGIDVWQLDDGKVVEYWVASDGLRLMAQLGIGE